MARGSIFWRCGRCRKIWKTKPATCTHRGAGYYVVVRDLGKQYWKAAGLNRKEAERKLQDFTHQIEHGTYSKKKPISFSDFADHWLANYATGAVKESTLSTYKTLIETRLKPFFGSRSLKHITAERVQGFISKTLSVCSPKTVNNHLILLKTILNHAEQWGYLSNNPARRISKVRLAYKEMDVLMPDEIRALVEQSLEPYRTLFLTAVLTGMRRGELLGLQWGDIDWRRRAIFVRRGLYWKSKKDMTDADKSIRWRFVSPKSRQSIRTIVMSPTLQRSLDLYKHVCPDSRHDLVFCAQDGDPMDPDNLVKRQFIPALKRAGIRKVRFHDLRHTYTSLLIAQGENVKFIQTQLGHASVQTTLDRYGHLLPASQQEVGERLDNQVFGPAPQDVACKENHLRQAL